MNEKTYLMGAHSLESRTDAPAAPLLTFASAGGGVGKSTLALVAAHLCARAGLRTCLVEADLQFGDYGFWMGLPLESPSLAKGGTGSAITIADRLDLFKAPPLPETAEDLADGVAALVARLRGRYDLVIADTGQFWSGLTAELVSTASAVALVFDGRSSSVASALKATELCGRIGVAGVRLVHVCNRWGARGSVAKGDVKKAFDGVRFVSDGRLVVDARVSRGQADALIETSNPMTVDVDGLLFELLPRMGLAYGERAAKRKGGLFS
jgi:Flp pilus assembly CpaE family ATPase